MQIYLSDLQATIDLGKRMAGVIPAKEPPAILLQGALGTGKTTLVRELVKSLPGGEKAEVSSTSFNLLNNYLTTPEVAHIDLYRVPFGEVEDDILDYFFEPAYLALVEWIEQIPTSMWPRDYLYINFEFVPLENKHSARWVTFSTSSAGTRQILEKLDPKLFARDGEKNL